MAILSSSLSRAALKMRHQAFQYLSMHFDYIQLARLLRTTVHRFREDAELTQMVTMVEHLILEMEQNEHGNHHHHDNNAHEQEVPKYAEVFNDVSSILSAFLCVNGSDRAGPTLPPKLAFDIHSFRGQVESKQGHYEQAIQSYLKALWIASSTDVIPDEQLALTVHRLAMAYDSFGDIHQSIALYRKALQLYEDAHVPKDHVCVAAAWTRLMHLETESAHRDNRSIRAIGKLELIDEETTTDSLEDSVV